MKTLTIIALVAVIGLAGLQAWMRLAPLEPETFHTAITPPEAGTGQWTGTNSHTEVFDTDRALADAFALLDETILATPRTTRIAGDLGSGRITYVTRSAFWGFPDYTTVEVVPEAEGSRISVYARARYGRSDLGVNAARVADWIAAVRGA